MGLLKELKKGVKTGFKSVVKAGKSAIVNDPLLKTGKALAVDLPVAAMGGSIEGAIGGKDGGNQESIPDMQTSGFTEEQKKKLRQRQGINATRLNKRGSLLLQEENTRRPTLLAK